MKDNKVISCDHCKHPILKDGIHISYELFERLDDGMLSFEKEERKYYHLKCLIAATELFVVKEMI